MCRSSHASGAHPVERSDYSALVGRAETPPHPLRGFVTAIASLLSMIFVSVCWFFYWFSAIPAAMPAPSDVSPAPDVDVAYIDDAIGEDDR